LHLHFEDIDHVRLREWFLDSSEPLLGASMKSQAQIKDRISEQDYSSRRTILVKADINTRLAQLRSLKTATKKRRGLKKKASAK
jgi:hypothetical protein